MAQERVAEETLQIYVQLEILVSSHVVVQCSTEREGRFFWMKITWVIEARLFLNMKKFWFI